MKTKFQTILYVAVAAITFSSCASLRTYESPVEEVTENLTFRTDELPEDSLSIAEFSWQDIFEDAQLQSYISQALNNNIDVRIALENIEIANAYLAQARVNTLPSLNVSPEGSYSTSSLNTQFGQIIGERQH